MGEFLTWRFQNCFDALIRGCGQGIKVKTTNIEYRNCPNWSKEAHKKWKQNEKGKPFAGLRYEHIAPVQKITQMLLALRKPGQVVKSNEVLQLLENYCHACVILKAEDKWLKPKDSMPETWAQKDIWARYKSGNARQIEVGIITEGDLNTWQSKIL